VQDVIVIDLDYYLSKEREKIHSMNIVMRIPYLTIIKGITIINIEEAHTSSSRS